MKTAGIIAEYNPFHNGHFYQISQVRKKSGADYIIVAMSGDYVQRGTPALLSKYARAEMALRCGADLVLELPVSCSTASAEGFAMGGVSLLNSLGIVDMICFGSESGNVRILKDLAEVLAEEPVKYQVNLREALSNGMSYPAARDLALVKYMNNNQISGILSSPNNILGIEYCKALLKLNSSIQPVALKRAGAGYHDENFTEDGFSSATAVRKLFLSEESDKEALKTQVPPVVYPVLMKALKSNSFITEKDFDSILYYCLLKAEADELSRFCDVSDSLAKRIKNQLNHYHGFSSFSSLLKTRDITQTRVQRALLHIILGIREIPDHVPYASILGFRKESSPLLTKIKEKSSIPLLSKSADAEKILSEEDMKLFRMNTFASNLYEGILAEKSSQDFVHEYSRQMVIV